MWLFNILALLLAAFILSYLLKEDICDTLPITTGILILLLYVLAFFRGLHGIDVIAIVFLILFIVFLFLLKKERRKDIIYNMRSVLLHPQMLVFLLSMILLFFCVKDQIALWWDDVNYWATDVKGLYYLNGFAGKYGNVSPEFGDYPPAVQLFKWWFLHFDAKTFHEGYMFAGYYCLNLIFLLPLLKKLKTKNIFIQFLACLVIFLLPGVINGIYFSGTCSDITMGIVYGAVLWSIWDYKGHTSLFYYIRLMVYLCVLVLTKSVGMEWACFGILFFLIFYIKWKEQGEIPFQKGNRIKILLLFLLPSMTQLSWMIFCLFNRRVAKLTSAGVHMAVGGKYQIPDNAMEKMGYFLRGFAFYPMHSDKTWGLDLSMLMLLIIFAVAFFIGRRTKLLQAYETKKLSIFTIITAFASLGLIFIAHITIFAGELQYLDSFVMAVSIARYGAPFTLGMLYLLFGILQSRVSVKKAYTIFFIFVLLTTNYVGMYTTLYGYRNTVEQNIKERNDMIDENAKRFLKVIDGETMLWGKRVLYLRDDNTIHWVKDTYVGNAVAPVAVVYNGIATDGMSQADIMNKIEESHAVYLYVDEVMGDAAPLFEGMLTDDDFAYDTLYVIQYTDNQIALEKVKGY